MPAFDLIPSILVDSFVITMVTYTITLSMALIFARKLMYEVDSNQELLALVCMFYIFYYVINLFLILLSFYLLRYKFAIDVKLTFQCREYSHIRFGIFRRWPLNLLILQACFSPNFSKLWSSFAKNLSFFTFSLKLCYDKTITYFVLWIYYNDG